MVQSPACCLRGLQNVANHGEVFMLTRRNLIAAGASAAATAAATSAFAAWEENLRYPDPRVEILDPSFARYRIAQASVQQLYTGARWSEGPVWFGDGRYVLWSDI